MLDSTNVRTCKMKEYQPLKDVENENCPRPQNHQKKNEKIDGGHRQRKFDQNYGRNSGVPSRVNTRCDYEDDFMKKINT